MLRFKIEVMVQMLAVEEKQNQSLLKRLEASKFLALSHGYKHRNVSNDTFFKSYV